MRKRLAFIMWASAGLCSSSIGPVACVSHSCTAMGCLDTETLTFSTTVAEVTETDISACRNDHCWHGRVANADLTTNNSRLDLQPEEGADAAAWFLDGYIDSQSQPGKALFRLSWSARSAERVAVGDVLSATFSDSSGSDLLRQTGTLSTFSEYYPNGEDCDDVACRSGSVEGGPAD
jgi:hypothetical protein